MAKRSRDRVTLDVGGQQFSTSVTTLSGSSEFFSRMFSQDWQAVLDGDSIFLDRDADAFKVLLSCMRNRRVLLPESDKDLCARVLLEASYFGVSWLLREVKHKALQHVATPEFDDGMLGVGSNAWEQALEEFESDLQRQHDDVDHGARAFDERFGGLDGALDNGVLPERYFSAGPAEHKAKIRQLLPAPEADRVVFANGENHEGVRVRPVAYALVEERDGSTYVDAVIPSREDHRGEFNDNHDQLILASQHMEWQGWTHCSWCIKRRPDNISSFAEGYPSRDGGLG